MAVEAEVSCAGVTGHAAGFVTTVTVSIDGTVYVQSSHTPGEDWWSFDMPLPGLDGEHTIVVSDLTAGDVYRGDPGNVVAAVNLSCAVPASSSTTTTLPPPTSVDLGQPDPDVSLPVEVEPTTSVWLGTAPVPSAVIVAGPVPTVAVVQVSTANTLPATGFPSATAIGIGWAFILCGVAAVACTRRRKVQA